ncbi:pickpocket protein 28-like [Arctopsyche grandis]|uniref:pickpocket protein 28-like n=1 Tax=Arctopsyche grandis TaxID=121162 RepID=UPI00406D8B16
MIVEGSPSKYKNTKVTESPGRKSNFDEDGDNEEDQKEDFCSTNFEDFTSCTSLHGLQYLSISKRTKTERLWWLLMILLSMGACGTMISKVWLKWYQSPVIVSFAESSTPVWQIPFPAVTICSETRVRQSVFNYTDAYHKTRTKKNVSFTEEEYFKMEAASLLCRNIVKNGSDIVNRTTIDYLKEFGQSFNEMFNKCEWKKKDIDCKELFRPVFTESGQCYTFNILDAEELFRKKVIYNDLHSFENGTKSDGWTMDRGYPGNLSANTYPERGTTSGADGSLTVVLKTYYKDIDYLCATSLQGFKISLHAPSDFPRVSQQYFMVPLQQDLIAAIKPNMIITSKGLRGYDPQRRKCFMTVERKLKFFKVYTQQNCQIECLSNYTDSVCGCVAFWMPRSRSIPVCSSMKKVCMSKAQDDLQKLELRYALAVRSKDKEQVKNLENLMKCDCLPACTSLIYDSEVSQSDFHWLDLAKAKKKDTPRIKEFGLSRVSMFFKDAEFIMSRRSELYGITDFLANCGGIMGLFLGFSFLSLVEIIYFLTIKPICNFRRKKITQTDTLRNSLAKK